MLAKTLIVFVLRVIKQIECLSNVLMQIKSRLSPKNCVIASKGTIETRFKRFEQKVF